MTVKVKTVSVTYGRKFNLGDFNSATVGCTIWADVTDDQDLNAAMHGLWSMAKSNVKEQAVPLLAKQTAKTETAFLGLPLELRQAITSNGVEDDYDPTDRGHGSMPHEFGDQ